MSTLYDFLVNISFLIFFLMIYFIYMMFKDDKKIWFILYLFICLLFGVNINIVGKGYGIFLIAIISLIFEIILYVILLYYFGLKDKSLFYTMLFSGAIIVILYSAYKRLKYEGILKIEFIDNLESIDVFRIISIIIQNEWIKGIIIAASGGVVSGLVLNKISKNK